MEFKVEEINNNGLALNLDTGNNSPSIVRLIWMRDILIHTFKSYYLFDHIMNVITRSNAKIVKISNKNKYVELTSLSQEQIDELLDQLNSILVMEKLVN